jgi:hypothetical protein
LEDLIMSETFWIIAEIIAGIAILGIVSAAITAVMVPLLSKRPSSIEILGERYARGELTREQYMQMCRDLGMGVADEEGILMGIAPGREADSAPASRKPT